MYGVNEAVTQRTLDGFKVKVEGDFGESAENLSGCDNVEPDQDGLEGWEIFFADGEVAGLQIPCQ